MRRCVAVVLLVLCLAVAAEEAPSILRAIKIEEPVVNISRSESITATRYSVNCSTENSASGDSPLGMSQGHVAKASISGTPERLSLSRCGLRRLSDACFPRYRAPPPSIDLSRNYLADIDAGGLFSGLRRALASTRALDLSFNVLSAVSTRWTRIAPLLRVLDISHNNVSFVEHGSLAALSHLRSFNASFNHFPSPLPLREYPTALRSLDLSNNGITLLADDGVTHLHELRTLSLAGNRLSHLRVTWFEGLSALRVLDLSDNDVRTLDDGLFASLVRLQYIYLRANRIQVLAPGCFYGLTALQTLDLGDNIITALENCSFTPLTKLHSLSLRQNHLKALNENCFTGLASLEELDLSGNRLISLEKATFASLTSLQRLNLSGNLLEALGDGYWTGLYVLSHLDISKNGLVQLENSSFAELGASLLALDVSRNRVEALGEAAFAGLTRLQHLDASENELRTIWPGAFAPLAGLTELRVAGNPLLPTQRLLPASRRLQRVDASRTHLRQVPAALTRSVRVLALSGNVVAAVRRGDLDSYPLLRVLILSNNLVADVEEDALGRLENLAELHLDGNKLSTVPRSLPASLRLLHLQRNLITELRASDLQGLPHLKELSLRDCTLNAIDSEVFAQLNALEDLDLSFNPLLSLPPDGLTGPGRMRVLRLSHLPLLLPPHSDGNGTGGGSSGSGGGGSGIGLFPVGSPEHLEILTLDGSPLLAQQLLGDAAALAALRQLRKLDLRGAGLRHLRADLASYLPRLSTLYLSNNPWSCVHAADTLRLAGLLRAQAINTIGDKTADIEAAACNEPTSLKGHPIVELTTEEFLVNGGSVPLEAGVDTIPTCPTLVALCHEVFSENVTTISISPTITTTISSDPTRTPSYIPINTSPQEITKLQPQSFTLSTSTPHLIHNLRTGTAAKDDKALKSRSFYATKMVVAISNQQNERLHNFSTLQGATTVPLPWRPSSVLSSTPQLGPSTRINILTSRIISAHYGSSATNSSSPRIAISKASFSTTERLATAMSSIRTLPSLLSQPSMIVPLSSKRTFTNNPQTIRSATSSAKDMSRDKPCMRDKAAITKVASTPINTTCADGPKSLTKQKQTSSPLSQSLQDQPALDSTQIMGLFKDETQSKLKQDHDLRNINVLQTRQDAARSSPIHHIRANEDQAQSFPAEATKKKDYSVSGTSTRNTVDKPPDSFALATSSEEWRGGENLLLQNTSSLAQTRAAEPHSVADNVPGAGGNGSHPGMFVLAAVGVAVVAALATALSHCASRHHRRRRAVEYSRQQDIEVRSISSVGVSDLW